jgi:hypothetical protein
MRLVVLAGAGVAAAALLSFVARNYEVVQRDLAVKTVRIDVLGLFSFDASPEVRPTIDVFTSIVLLTVASMACSLLLLLQRANRRPSAHVRRFYALLAVGAAYLGLDELVGIHEIIGQNVGGAFDVFGAHAADDVVYASYAIPAVAFVVAFRDVVSASRLAAPTLGLAGILFAASALLDGTDASTVLEDVCEIAAAVLVLAASAKIVTDQALVALGLRGRAAAVSRGAATDGRLPRDSPLGPPRGAVTRAGR